MKSLMKAENILKDNQTAYIQGGEVPRGRVKVSGAKNAATRLLAAALLADEKVTLENFPTELVDANYKIDFIRKNGGKVEIDNDHEIITIDSEWISTKELSSYDYPIRTTYLLVPGLIKRSGFAKIPYPGGCKIGNRGYDLHILTWERLGATVEERENFIEVSAPKGLKGAEINFPISTIGGTESALICGAMAQGTTIVKNAYISPEIESLIHFLRIMGVSVEVAGNSFIKIHGEKQHRGGVFRVMPDRIEALTWLVYGALSKGTITIENVPFKAMEIPLIHVQEAGIDFFSNKNNIYISPDCLTNGIIQPFELATGTHPGVISDMQPFYVLLGLYADGISRIYDYRYPERLKYCAELKRFFSDQIRWEKGLITTYGSFQSKPKASFAASTDLRGSMAVVIAALLAQGPSEISNVEMALRGYNKLQEKLAALGVSMVVA